MHNIYESERIISREKIVMRRLDRSKLEIITFFVGLFNFQDSNRGHPTSETILRVRWGANFTHLSAMHGD